jgi:hypothetical protein
MDSLIKKTEKSSPEKMVPIFNPGIIFLMFTDNDYNYTPPSINGIFSKVEEYVG